VAGSLTSNAAAAQDLFAYVLRLGGGCAAGIWSQRRPLP